LRMGARCALEDLATVLEHYCLLGKSSHYVVNRAECYDANTEITPW